MSRPPAGSSASPTGYAFYMERRVDEKDGRWTASYPEADWSVAGASEGDARMRLRDGVTRRQNAGEDALAYASSVYERHLRSPVPGVYAMSNELYRELPPTSPTAGLPRVHRDDAQTTPHPNNAS